MIPETEFKSILERLLFTQSKEREDQIVEHLRLSRAYKNLHSMTPRYTRNKDLRVLYSIGKLIRDTELYMLVK